MVGNDATGLKRIAAHFGKYFDEQRSVHKYEVTFFVISYANQLLVVLSYAQASNS